MPWEPLPGSAGEPEAVQRSLDRVVRSLGGPGGEALRTLFARWPELVGEDLAAVTTPESLRDGRLVVSVADPAWASEVGFRRGEVLERLVAALGPGTVTAMEVRVRRGGRTGG